MKNYSLEYDLTTGLLNAVVRTIKIGLSSVTKIKAIKEAREKWKIEYLKNREGNKARNPRLNYSINLK